jgi:hypothetical protein
MMKNTCGIDKNPKKYHKKISQKNRALPYANDNAPSGLVNM